MPSLLANLFGWMKKGSRSRWGGRRALASFLMQGTAIGVYTNSWTDSRYEQVRHFRNWVYVAVDRIATEVAMHMPNVSLVRGADELVRLPGLGRRACDPRTKRPGKFPVLGPHPRSKALTPLLAHEELEPVPHNHPLLRLLRDPNEPDTAFDLWYETVLHLLLTGNAYWWLPPNALGYPAAAWVLPSHWVWANIGKERLIDSYEIRPVEGNYVRMSIPASDVIHFRKKSPISKIDGYSPLAAGSQWVDTEESISRSRWFSFRNGIFPGVAIEFDERTKVPDEETLNRFEAKIMGRYGQEINSNRPFFVPPGAKVRKMQLTAPELQYYESEDQLADMVLHLFKVPPACVGREKGMTFGSRRASDAALYGGCVNPLFRFFGQAVSEKLGPRYDRRLRVWWEDRTPLDPEVEDQRIRTAFACGAVTPNEIRAEHGREPFPHGGDDPVLQGAMMVMPWVTGGKIQHINSDDADSPAAAPLVHQPEDPEDE